MAGFPTERVRRLAAVVIAASLLGAAPVWAQADPDASAGQEAPSPAPSAVAVFAPRAPTALRAVDGGVRLWIVQELRRGGVPVVATAHTDAVAAHQLAAGRPFLRGSDAKALATECESGAVLLTKIGVEDGKLELWIRAYDGNGELIAVGRGAARVAALGEALVEALRPVQAAFGAGSTETQQPPRLAELGSYERALERLTSGELAAAWHELTGIRSPTAEALREDIVTLSAAPGVVAAERSRLSSLRGASDPDWLAIRHSLQRERNEALLLAGAAHASAADDPEGALVLFAEAAKAAPGSLAAERGRARVLAALDRHTDAKVAFERVIALASEDVEARLTLARNPTLAPEEQASRLFEAGALQARALDEEGARASFATAASIDADLGAVTRRHVARLEETLGNDVEALGAWDEAAAADATDLEALEGLGRMRSRSGDAAGAGVAFAKVLERQPEDPEALLGYGQSLLAQGKAEQALPQLEKALALAPHEADARGSLARALTATGQADAALRVLDPARVDPTERAQILTQSAEIHAEAGRLVEAQAALEQAVEIEPDEPPLRSALAKLHTRAGNLDAARQEEARVVALSGVAQEIETSDLTIRPASGSEARGGDEFATLAASFPTATPERRPIRRVAWLGLAPVQSWPSRVRAWFMPQALDTVALEAALRAAFAARFQIETPRPVPGAAEPSLASVRAFGTERGDLALLNDVLDVDALIVVRFAPSEPEGWFDPPVRAVDFEVRLASGRSAGAVWMLGNAASLSDAGRYLRWNWRAGISLAVLASLLLLPVLRGWGSITVVLDYERTRGAQGFFSIELSRRPGRTKQERKQGSGRSRAAKYQRRVRSWSRFTRHMVGRETRMGWLPARQWYVAVHGLLQDTASQEVIGNYLEERKIRVTRGRCSEVVFDFRRKAAPIEVRLRREEGAAPLQGRVAVLGAPDSLRFVKDDSATLFLGPGKHTLLIGVADRVFERVVEVRELVGQLVGVAVDDADGAAFSGCTEAVEPYLQGDLMTASQALERADKREPALLLRATYHRLRGETEAAARCLEQLGRFAEAAELAKDSPVPKRSAGLFEKAGDFHSAAAAHARAGDPLEAARAYEAGFEYAAAIDAYRAAGVREKALELLEKTGRFFEAGTLALELQDGDRAIRCLQQVGSREGDYADACEALANLFAQRDAFDLAVEKAREAIEARGADDAPLDAQEGLAKLLERAGREAEALAVWENIRKRDFQFKGAGEKIEALRQGVAATQRSSAASTTAAAGATTAAVPAVASESRYEVLGEIGRGGMGVVVKARDRRLGRIVALKRMPDNLKSHPTAVQLFLREARAAAALSHPNIVTLFDAGQEADGSYFLTMELLEGFGLDTLLKKRGHLSARDAVRIGVQIAKGLQFAHEKGVVHRDIKTANLFFTKERVVKIMDFGLAKMTEEVRRSATVIGGTPYYMAPEQAAGEAVDQRTDLYALGVTLFELVTGSVPFREGDVTHQHRHAPVPDPRGRVADLPEPLAALILQLMAKAPDQRPATTADVVRTLEKLLAQLGVGTAPSAPGTS
jgi:tetratricopeptide (TPR) repeat protein